MRTSARSLDSSGFDEHARHFGQLRLPFFFVSWRPLGRPSCGSFWVNIRFFGNGFLWFRPYGGSLFQTPKSKQKAWPLRSAPRCGSAFLRSGIHPGASPTVCFAAPPLDACGCAARSLRSHPRINPSTQPSDGAGTSKAVLELTLIVLSGERRKATAFAFALIVPTLCVGMQPGTLRVPFLKPTKKCDPFKSRL